MWSEYIRKLDDLPALTQFWEVDFAEIVSRVLKKREINKILEVGCSNGRWLRWFVRHINAEGYGVDLESASFSNDLHFVRSDAFNLPYANGSFDVVFSLGFLEHFRSTERSKLLKEQKRVLRSGGILICQVPNLWLSLEHLKVRYFYDLRRGYRHFSVSPTKFLNLLRDLDLELIFWGYTGAFFETRFLRRVAFSKPIFATEMLAIVRNG